MPGWDFRCKQCGGIQTEYFKSVQQADEKAVYCRRPGCQPAVPGGVCRMERMPSAPSFTIGGYNAKNGYSKEGA